MLSQKGIVAERHGTGAGGQRRDGSGLQPSAILNYEQNRLASSLDSSRLIGMHSMPLNNPWAIALATVLVLCVIEGCSTPASKWPTTAELPAQPSLPDPLVMFSGERVTTPQQWFQQRRPELRKLFQHYMYGFLPPLPQKTSFQNEGIFTDFLGGRATLKLITIQAGPEGAPRIQLMLILPNHPAGPVPLFLGMNFCGNHALVADPRVPLTQGWVYDSCKGCTNGQATDLGRGSQAGDWAIEKTLSRGYGFAAFCSSDIDSDRKDVSSGVYAWLAKHWSDPTLAAPANRGSIAAWAWGFHRCVDYLVQDPAVDAHRIAVVGHSRNGKTALLAAAMDDRIALAIPLQAGCGGTAPNRGKVGESVARINTAFPHWFNANFKQFNDHPERLPFDQNALVALCAPRPVLFANAQEDQWANPSGQFEVLQAADPVYRFLGSSGLEAKAMPEIGTLSDGALGYFIRAGKHSMTAEDWNVFLAFADRHFQISAKH